MVNFGGAKVQLFFNVTQYPRYFFTNRCIPANSRRFVWWIDGFPFGIALPFLFLFLKKMRSDFAVPSAFLGDKTTFQQGRKSRLYRILYIYVFDF